jgi:hypothetical protein
MIDTIESIEPLPVAIRELGQRYAAGQITRERRDARLVELHKRQPTLRRKRARSLSLTTPAPVQFYSLDEARA